MKVSIKVSVNRIGDQPWSHVYKRDGAREGVVLTKHGMVEVYSESGLTVLRVVRNGCAYREDRLKDYTKRHLVTLANRFAERVKKSDVWPAMSFADNRRAL